MESCFIYTLGADQVVLLPSHRLHQQCSDLQQYPASQCSTTDNAHSQVLLLGCEPERQKWYYTKRSRYVEFQMKTYNRLCQKITCVCLLT